MKRPTPAQMQKAVAKFNATIPVGSLVSVWKGVRAGNPTLEAVVEQPGAFILGGHTPVVKIPGDCIALTHVELVCKF